MERKPAFLRQALSRVYREEAVAKAYLQRTPYPPALFDTLAGIGDPACPDALDVGCGTGDVARHLATRLRRVDAVDPSRAMLAVARKSPGGDRENLAWIEGVAETAPFRGPYGLVTAGQSLAWMEWEVVLPRFAGVLSSAGVVALVERAEPGCPWGDGLREIVVRRSTNRHYKAYDLSDELERRSLWRPIGRREIPPVTFRQSVEAYLEGLHSRQSLARSGLGPESAAAFDAEVRALLAPYACGGALEVPAGAEVVWGVPSP